MHCTFEGWLIIVIFMWLLSTLLAYKCQEVYLLSLVLRKGKKVYMLSSFQAVQFPSSVSVGMRIIRSRQARPRPRPYVSVRASRTGGWTRGRSVDVIDSCYRSEYIWRRLLAGRRRDCLVLFL